MFDLKNIRSGQNVIKKAQPKKKKQKYVTVCQNNGTRHPYKFFWLSILEIF